MKIIIEPDYANETLSSIFQHLRLLRHPCILTYVNGQEVEEGPHLYTEKAIPLASVIQDLTPIEISAGLYNILEALSFLHEKVFISDGFPTLVDTSRNSKQE